MGALLGRAAAAPAPQADADQCPEPPQSAVPCMHNAANRCAADSPRAVLPSHDGRLHHAPRLLPHRPTPPEPQCTPGTSCVHIPMLLGHGSHRIRAPSGLQHVPLPAHPAFQMALLLLPTMLWNHDRSSSMVDMQMVFNLGHHHAWGPRTRHGGRPRRDGRAAHVGESDRVVPTHTVPWLSPTGWSTRRSVWGARLGGRGNLRNRNRTVLLHTIHTLRGMPDVAPSHPSHTKSRTWDSGPKAAHPASARARWACWWLQSQSQPSPGLWPRT